MVEQELQSVYKYDLGKNGVRVLKICTHGISVWIVEMGGSFSLVV